VKVARDLAQTSPLSMSLGIRQIRADKDSVIFELPFGDHIALPGAQNASQGSGVMLLDQAMGAAFSARTKSNIRVSTVDLRVEWLNAICQERALMAEASVIARIGDLYVIKSKLYHKDDCEVLAHATGTFLPSWNMSTQAIPGDTEQTRWSSGTDFDDFCSLLCLKAKQEFYQFGPAPHLTGNIDPPMVHGGAAGAAIVTVAGKLLVSERRSFIPATTSLRFLRPLSANIPTCVDVRPERIGKRVLSLTARVWQTTFSGEATLPLILAECIFVRTP
jgi:acyl-coenzyme A thioesterase PaaI-like protein